MKEALLEKIKRLLHGTFLSPHKFRITPFESGVDDDGKMWPKGFYLVWCTCGKNFKKETL